MGILTREEVLDLKKTPEPAGYCAGDVAGRH